jgi:hypothetical protein
MSIEKALKNPADVYNDPNQVLQDASLTREEKIKIMKQWEYDARILEVAEEENMAGGKPSLLRDVRKALIELEGGGTMDDSVKTKQG